MSRAGLVVMLISGSAFALPPNSPYREGANHRVGDDSFVGRLGRAPIATDSEQARMKIHLEYVRGELAAKPATRPALAAKRSELLGYLDDYIAKGITPTNWGLPWRTPVFIDDRGSICAVGYLIERSVGRALPETIAKTHRYDYLEDIAAAMPEVARWIESSGFTLDELASIQPGYTEPAADTWQRWFATHIPDGEYQSIERESAAQGRFENHKMQGEWKTFAATIGEGTEARTIDPEAPVIGRGTLRNGHGEWTSYYDDGKLLAKGRYVDNDPQGTWRFFHPSGHLAAIGELRGGTRFGRWEFFHDTEKRTRIATGRFGAGGSVTGRWRHYGADGKLIAISHQETPSQWTWARNTAGPNTSEGQVLHIVPGADRVRHSISVGTMDQATYRLDTFALGRERLYVYDPPYEKDEIYDAGGTLLTRRGDGWVGANCHWGTKRKAIAATGDVARMHGLLFREMRARDADGDNTGPTNCAAEKPIAPARAARIDAMLASREQVRAASPAFVRDLVLGDNQYLDDQDKADAEDLTRVITTHMTFYVEWPHIDGRFIQVFRTLPGHVQRFWWDDMMGDSEP
jgi:hypothetical protein